MTLALNLLLIQSHTSAPEVGIKHASLFDQSETCFFGRCQTLRASRFSPETDRLGCFLVEVEAGLSSY